jgi:hypothetical protein
MGAKNYRPVYNYRIVFEKKDGNFDIGKGYAVTQKEAEVNFNSVRLQLKPSTLKRSELYFRDQLIKKI